MRKKNIIQMIRDIFKKYKYNVLILEQRGKTDQIWIDKANIVLDKNLGQVLELKIRNEKIPVDLNNAISDHLGRIWFLYYSNHPGIYWPIQRISATELEVEVEEELEDGQKVKRKKLVPIPVFLPKPDPRAIQGYLEGLKIANEVYVEPKTWWEKNLPFIAWAVVIVFSAWYLKGLVGEFTKAVATYGQAIAKNSEAIKKLSEALINIGRAAKPPY